MTRVLRNGWVLGLLWCVALADFYCVWSRNDQISMGDNYAFTSWLTVAFTPALGYTGPGLRGEFPIHIMLTPEGGFTEFEEQELGSIDWDQGWQHLGAISFVRVRAASGPFAPLWTRHRYMLQKRVRLPATGSSSQLYGSTPLELLPIASGYIDRVVAHLNLGATLGPDARATLASGGRVERVRPSYIGILHNLLSLMVFASLLGGTRARRTWLREQRRLARFLCPTCKYDLRGLGSGVCPECGEEAVVR